MCKYEKKKCKSAPPKEEKAEIKENRFGFEPEITAKISKIKDIRIYEVGISYNGRTYKEGKKIGWKDGFRALWCILKYNLIRDRTGQDRTGQDRTGQDIL